MTVPQKLVKSVIPSKPSKDKAKSTKVFVWVDNILITFEWIEGSSLYNANLFGWNSGVDKRLTLCDCRTINICKLVILGSKRFRISICLSSGVTREWWGESTNDKELSCIHKLSTVLSISQCASSIVESYIGSTKCLRLFDASLATRHKCCGCLARNRSSHLANGSKKSWFDTASTVARIRQRKILNKRRLQHANGKADVIKANKPARGGRKDLRYPHKKRKIFNKESSGNESKVIDFWFVGVDNGGVGFFVSCCGDTGITPSGRLPRIGIGDVEVCVAELIRRFEGRDVIDSLLTNSHDVEFGEVEGRIIEEKERNDDKEEKGKYWKWNCEAMNSSKLEE